MHTALVPNSVCKQQSVSSVNLLYQFSVNDTGSKLLGVVKE